MNHNEHNSTTVYTRTSLPIPSCARRAYLMLSHAPFLCEVCTWWTHITVARVVHCGHNVLCQKQNAKQIAHLQRKWKGIFHSQFQRPTKENKTKSNQRLQTLARTSFEWCTFIVFRVNPKWLPNHVTYDIIRVTLFLMYRRSYVWSFASTFSAISEKFFEEKKRKLNN